MDKELDVKVRKTTEKISENLHIIGNEPSLAFYRIQEHVRRIVPVIVERQGDVAGLQQDLQGHAYDIEYSLGAIKSFNDSKATFDNIHELLKNAIFLKQQLKFVESRRPKRDKDSASNIYKRFSNIPDLSRVESLFSSSSSAASASGTNNSNSAGGGGGGGSFRNSMPPPAEFHKSNTSMY